MVVLMTREDKDKQTVKAINLLLDTLPAASRDKVVAHIVKTAKPAQKKG